MTTLSLVLAALAVTTTAPEPEQEPPIHITGETAEYRGKARQLRVVGDVRVVRDTATIIADELLYDVGRKVLISSGPATLLEGESRTQGDNLVYDVSASSGRILRSYAVYGPWRVWGREIERRGPKETVVARGQFTTCDLDPPHYRFSSPRTNIRPDDRITATHALLRVGEVPVLYTPFLYQSLRKRRYTITLRPGQSSADGFFAKGMFLWPFNDAVESRVYGDYFSRRGWGHGGELSYDQPSRRKGSVYGYRIVDRSEARTRWNVRAAHVEEFGAGLSGLVNLNVQSDGAFANQFLREDWVRVRREARSQLALTESRPTWTARAAAERVDVFSADPSSPTVGRFVRESADLPRFEFFTTPLPLLGPVYTSFSSTLRRQFLDSIVEGPKTRWSGETAADFTSSLRLTRDITFIPLVGWRERYEQEPTSRRGQFLESYRTGATVRTRVSRVWDVDLAHSFGQDLGVENDPNRGITQHRVDLRLTGRLGRTVSVNGTGGYDLRPDLKPFFGPEASRRDRISDQTADLTWQPDPRWRVYAREMFSPSRATLTGMEEEVHHDHGSWSLLERVAWDRSQPKRVVVTNQASFPFTAKWRVVGTIRYEVTQAGLTAHALEHDYAFVRDLHCWEMKITHRRRPGLTETWGTLEIKLPQGSSRPAARRQEWFPWSEPAPATLR